MGSQSILSYISDVYIGMRMMCFVYLHTNALIFLMWHYETHIQTSDLIAISPSF